MTEPPTVLYIRVTPGLSDRITAEQQRVSTAELYTSKARLVAELLIEALDARERDRPTHP